MSLLLQNVLVMDPKSKYHRKKADIYIKNGRIASLSESTASRIIDCEGKLVTPGWVDLNADFCDPGYEFKEDILSGSKTAQSGGFTDVHLVSKTHPAVTLKSDIEYLKKWVIPPVDLHISASISEGQKGENLTEMMDLFHHGARSFSDGDLSIWNTELLIKSLQYTAPMNVPIFQSARDIHLSRATHMHEGVTSTKLGIRGEPSLSEELIVSRDLDILRFSGGHLHFSKISTKRSIELIKQAKKEGLPVTCDVSIHHLLFCDSHIDNFDTTYKSLPPFRTRADRSALIEAVKEGTVDAICSNHHPQDPENKHLEFDRAKPGTIALQTFYPALLRVKEIPFHVLVERMTYGPRKVLGIDEITIEEGSVSKLTVLDPEEEWVLNSKTNYSKSTNSPFWNQKLKGRAVGTVNGKTDVFE